MATKLRSRCLSARPRGYVCAIARRNRQKVARGREGRNAGGTCLNVGDASKSLLHAPRCSRGGHSFAKDGRPASRAEA